MRIILAVLLALAVPTASAQEKQPNTNTGSFKPVPAVKNTAIINGETVIVKRDENNKIVFVKTIKPQIIHPIIVQVEISE